MDVVTRDREQRRRQQAALQQAGMLAQAAESAGKAAPMVKALTDGQAQPVAA
jgi:hypothetical protein